MESRTASSARRGCIDSMIMVLLLWIDDRREHIGRRGRRTPPEW